MATYFLVNIFLILTILPHELGHAIVGRLAGWRVFSVVVGIGKQALKFKLFGIFFIFNWLPVGGLTQSAPMDKRWYRTKRFLMIAAGPAVNAGIAGLIFFIWQDTWREFGFWGLPPLARICFFTNLWVMASNLLPRKSKISRRNTDGMQLLKTFSKNPDEMEEFGAGRFAMEAAIRRDEYKDLPGALEWCNKGLALFPKNYSLLTVNGSLCLDIGDYPRAREAFLQHLSGETKPGGKRYAILNNIAYADALINDPLLLPEADAYSKEAYNGLPWSPPIIGTRGTVLVAMGQIEEGIKLLKESFEKHDAPRGKAENAGHLAVAYARLGDFHQAAEYLKLTEQFNPECLLIKRAEAELAQATS